MFSSKPDELRSVSIIPDLAGDEEITPVPLADEVCHALPNRLLIPIKGGAIYMPVAFSYCTPVGHVGQMDD
jgi:hypothetical protein